VPVLKADPSSIRLLNRRKREFLWGEKIKNFIGQAGGENGMGNGL
jgi:hypothetical protein